MAWYQVKSVNDLQVGDTLAGTTPENRALVTATSRHGTYCIVTTRARDADTVSLFFYRNESCNVIIDQPTT